MQRKLKLLFLLPVLLLLAGCLEPYQPEVVQLPNKYLVVDGFINTGGGATTIKLSRTQNLGEAGAPPVESGATLMIEEEGGGARFNLREGSAGTYTIASLPLNPAKRYRLHIKTARNNRAYVSDFIPVKLTPDIEALTWVAEPDGLQLRVSTYDPASNSRYYRWDFEETWELTAAERATAEVVGDTILLRTSESENIHHCWRTEPSTTIVVGTSTRYSEDRISNYPLQKLSPASEKLRIGYSLLVKQYVLTEEAYSYWENLRRNTESVGGLFDPLPSQLVGNIRSVASAEEPVIGFLSAYSVTEKRLFVGREELPQQWFIPKPLCYGDSATMSMAAAIKEMKDPNSYWALKKLNLGELNVLNGYLMKYKGCVDCRIYGTNIKPTFWPR